MIDESFYFIYSIKGPEINSQLEINMLNILIHIYYQYNKMK